VRAVHLEMSIPRQRSDEVYATLSDLARYPELTDTVRSVVVTEVSDRVTISEWEVTFRAGLLRWREQDTFDPYAQTIDFSQLDGDLDVFDGSWRCSDRLGGSRITFDARLDLGIPSLAGALEPIAARALLDNTVLIVRALFPAAVVVTAGSVVGGDVVPGQVSA
jgi:ribosome-associated toxin RatA of RatAB toxin-antitoxin module